jgi:hypothetical protein
MGWISWQNLPQNRTDPAVRAFAIVPNDTTPLPTPVKGIYTGTGGALKVLLTGDTVPVVYTSVPAGVVLNICAQQVFATGGTTATGMIGHY